MSSLANSWRRSSIYTNTVSFNGFTSNTLPSPLGVDTRLPRLGKVLRAATYCSYSYTRQQRKRPHMPVISSGLSEMPCSLAILIEIGLNSVRNVEQHRLSNPHAPGPPNSLATSRGPTC